MFDKIIKALYGDVDQYDAEVSVLTEPICDYCTLYYCCCYVVCTETLISTMQRYGQAALGPSAWLVALQAVGSAAHTTYMQQQPSMSRMHQQRMSEPVCLQNLS
jgi:hypothetical protein